MTAKIDELISENGTIDDYDKMFYGYTNVQAEDENGEPYESNMILKADGNIKIPGMNLLSIKILEIL